MYQRHSTRRGAQPAVRRSHPQGPAAIPDWSKLGKEDTVEVSTAGGSVMAGTIDMIAPDRSVFWLIRHDGGGRTMVCCGDGVSVVKVHDSGGAPAGEPAPGCGPAAG
jgi:hypothetical protein